MNAKPTLSKYVFAAFVACAPQTRATSTSSRVTNFTPRLTRQEPNVDGANALILLSNPSGSMSESSSFFISAAPLGVECPGQQSRARMGRTSSARPAVIVTPWTVALSTLVYINDKQSVLKPFPRFRAIGSVSEAGSGVSSSAEPTIPKLLLRGHVSMVIPGNASRRRIICAGSLYMLPNPFSSKSFFVISKRELAASSIELEGAFFSHRSNHRMKSPTISCSEIASAQPRR